MELLKIVEEVFVDLSRFGQKGVTPDSYNKLKNRGVELSLFCKAKVLRSIDDGKLFLAEVVLENDEVLPIEIYGKVCNETRLNKTKRI